MTLLPTPLEEAAKAAYHATPRNKPYDKLTLFKKNLYRTEATAAITAYLAQAGKEGWVMVPKDPSPNMRFAGADYLLSQKRFVTASDMWPTWKVMLAAAQNGGE